MELDTNKKMRWAALTPPTSVFLRFAQKVYLGVRALHAAHGAEVGFAKGVTSEGLAFGKLTGKANAFKHGLGNNFTVKAVNCLASARRAVRVVNRIQANVEISFVLNHAVFQSTNPRAPRQPLVFAGSVTVGAGVLDALTVIVIRAHHNGATHRLGDDGGDALARLHGAAPRDADELASGNVYDAIGEGRERSGSGHVRVSQLGRGALRRAPLHPPQP